MEFYRCYVCGISEQKTMLFDALSSKEKGIIKLCENCSKREEFPIIKKPTIEQLKEAEKKPKYFELINPEKRQEYKKELVRAIPIGITEKSYNAPLPQQKNPKTNLVDNFHWIIMIARRKRKLTQQQLAKEIGESEIVIKMAERGILPEENSTLINKLESFLGIKIRKEADIESKKYATPKIQESEPVEHKKLSILKFDPHTIQNLTIRDLREGNLKIEEIEDTSKNNLNFDEERE